MKHTKERGQALVEFAIVIPVFMLLLAGMIQFGIILWGQNTLNQVARDTGRYAATLDCSTAAEGLAATRFGTLLTQAGGPWTFVAADVDYPAGSPCPPDKNTVHWVTVIGSAAIPIFFPWVPGVAPGGVLTASTEFRVEPEPAP